MNYISGEIAALITALMWTCSSFSFENAGKKIGSLNVNIIRLVLALIIISLYTLFTKSALFPTTATASQWLWLSLSGLVGFVLGDLFLFEALLLVGSRVAMLIMSLSPPMTAVFSFFILGETLSLASFIGMFLTVFGIAIVVLVKGEKEEKTKNLSFAHPVKGIVYAFLGAFGQALGLILSKFGMGQYDAFQATQIRIIAGLLGFIVYFTIVKQWRSLFTALKNKIGLLWSTVGAFFGPFLGVSFSLIAVKNTSAGIASTISSITPILLIPVAIFIKKEKVTFKEILGAIVTIFGVAILFL